MDHEVSDSQMIANYREENGDRDIRRNKCALNIKCKHTITTE